MTVTTAPGRVVRDAGGLRIEFSRRLDRAPVEVWSALTDNELLRAWFGVWSGDPDTGSVELLGVEDTEPVTVTIRACEPPARLDVDLPSEGATWRLSVSLSPEGDGTDLLFVHPLEAGDDPAGLGPGWHYYLDRLRAVVEGFTVPDDWDEYYPALAPAYAAPADGGA